MNTHALILLPVLFSIMNISCTGIPEGSPAAVNPAHLDHLYETIWMNGRECGIVHIYAEYPDYEWVGDPNEGIACVDDAARAAVFYLDYYRAHADGEALLKARNLLEFLLMMQADNGMFYNFIWDDHSINRDYIRSRAQADWWGFRAMWALREAAVLRKDLEPDLAARIDSALKRAVKAIPDFLPRNRDTVLYAGISCPDWLPHGAAADQAALLLMGLAPGLETDADPAAEQICRAMADGICLMQQDTAGIAPGAMLSWRNSWHAWGNLQSFALLRTAVQLNEPRYRSAALREIDFFYPGLRSDERVTGFTIRGTDNGTEIIDRTRYPQIAYDIRPVIYACIEAFRITGKDRYARQAAETALWFFGENAAGIPIYDAESGCCFDGINGPGEVNRNSGAESTIEALLSLQAIESCKPAADHLEDRLAAMKSGSAENR